MSWALSALREPLVLLNDHAHLEKKAANNALELLSRWPSESPPSKWVQRLSAIARDETQHLSTVTRLLARLGGRFSRAHTNQYASDLRLLVRRGTGPDEVVDRLLISALIEARSCERFELLAACDDVEVDGDLVKLYAGLCESERGHFHVFIELADMVPGAQAVAGRWAQMLDAEAAILKEQAPGARMHSGWRA
jgi:tRNA-(ms[2]io[6]A)-hydroxylase